MKIGILTFHRAHNYGAVLQCYALQETLNRNGYIAYIVDYRQSYIEGVYKTFSLKRFVELLKHPRGLLRYIKNINKRRFKNAIFSEFQSRFFRQTSVVYKGKFPNNIDLFIIGSDQVWGTHCTGGVDDIYMGDFRKKIGVNIVSYAISSTIKSLKLIGDKRLLKTLDNFSCLSFRENLIKEYYFDKTGYNARIDIDPTLLLKANDWNIIINEKWKNEKYVLLYEITGRGINGLLRKKANDLALTLNCRVIDLSFYNYSPEDFVSLFKYAQYVITSSFHGTVFSIIFKRPVFIVKWNDGHDERYVNLVKMLGAEQMLVESDFKIQLQNPNYDIIHYRLDLLRYKSLEYLKNIKDYI